jgi:hypothetical protein
MAPDARGPSRSCKEIIVSCFVCILARQKETCTGADVQLVISEGNALGWGEGEGG